MRHSSWIRSLGMAGLAACAAAGPPSDVPSDGVPSDGDGGDDSGTDGGFGDDVGVFSDADAYQFPADCGTVHCSADLHDVLDCNDQVVLTCPPSQGCAAGSCVSPCDAAKANNTAIGCDFFTQNLPTPEASAGSCFAVLVANTWNAPVAINVEYQGQTLTGDFLRVSKPYGALQPLMNGQLAPNEVGVVFLSAYSFPYGGPPTYWTDCPRGVTAAYTAEVANLDGTGIGDSFHITTTAPVVAYDIFPYGGALSYVTSSSLLLPTSAWGNEYIAVDGYPAQNEVLTPYLQIGAQEDGTNVTIIPTADIAPFNGVGGADAGTPHGYALNKGQYLQFVEEAELAGSFIQSDKPVSVFGGHTGVWIDTSCDDTLHQQILPAYLLGSTYNAVRYRDRKGTLTSNNEQVPWRFVGTVDGTTLQYDPPQPGAPASLNKGQLVEYDATGPFTVSSDAQHPFYLTGYMTGGGTSPGQAPGDPEFVNVIPPEAWLTSYLFLTDPSYNNATLVFVRGKAQDGTFKDVTLDCMGGPLTGWAPIGSGGAYEYTRADLVLQGMPQGNCTNGVHTATSAAPFAVTVWGYDDCVSYGFPAGMGTPPVNTVWKKPPPQ
jgi:hypothetical protein